VLGLVGSASAALPQGWQSQDIGTTGGSADESGGTWTVSGDGADVWGSSDAFHYAYVPLSGDGMIIARVVDNGTGSNSWAKGGVMIRETLDANSKHMIMALTGGDGSGIAFQGRFQDTGASSSSLHGTISASPPHWVKLEREGNTITGYHSADGVDWEVFTGGADNAGGTISNPIDIEMATDAYIGIFVTAHAAGEVRTYTFDNVGTELPKVAMRADPADGATHADTWANLSWAPGATAVSHDVYFSENFDDVSDGAESTFQGNQASTFFIVGFPGMPYPEGLVPGTTYYWRVDELEADGTTKYEGKVWSFTVPPKTAYYPDPADDAELVEPDAGLSWTKGFGAKLHYIYFGDNFDDVNNATVGMPLGDPSYNPGPLKLAKTYYWRVDEFDAIATYKGEVWSFTTEGGVGSPEPSNGAVDVKQIPVLTWSPGVYGASHQVYFGTDEDAVKNADTGSPEYKGTGDLGSETFEPVKLLWDTTYYWRIDDVNSVNPDSPWVGPVWSFTTANFLSVDDFESYNDIDPPDLGSNRIFEAWIDGYGIPTNGSLVGNEFPPYAEQTIVHSGNQSMPLSYDNSVGYSEATLTLTYPRDWTENGVNTLSIWFRGSPAGLVEAPAGTYTMSASGADIWGQADEFRYAWKQLSGVGSISAQVLSVENTDGWAKAGVMIRESLALGSKFAFVFVSPANGCRFQARLTTDADAMSDDSVTTLQAIEAPHWVKLERTASGDFNAYNSNDGVTWSPLAWNPRRVLMSPNVYIGIALTSHNVNEICKAEFSNVQTTGTVTPMMWTHEAIGTTMLCNDAEPMYVALNGSAVVTHDNPNAAQIDEWTQWNIDLQAFGINLTNVNTISLGFGDKTNPQAGGSGTAYFDDIRLLLPLLEPEPEPAP
jgi:hypothetical protein